MGSTTKFVFGLCTLLTTQLNSVHALPTSTPDLIRIDETICVGTAGTTEGEDSILESRAAKPFYAIAHRVLTVQGVQAAFSHGANAVEIDFQPWTKSGCAGGTARDVLQAVADQRRAGKPVAFVWFDNKNAVTQSALKDVTSAVNAASGQYFLATMNYSPCI
ncbi:hypothetical protein diail_7481 [Diaporthe ilicicola]|nr:hypothetical protein diail_7481 [Diaporthe ilicicola]